MLIKSMLVTAVIGVAAVGTAMRGGDCPLSACADAKAPKVVANVISQDGDCPASACCEETGKKIELVANVVTQDGECTASSPATNVAAAEMPDNLPMMTCVVGDQTTHCAIEARRIAKATGATPVYVVRGVQYDCAMEAGTAYAKQLENYLNDLTTVQSTVNGECQECPVTAAAKSKECGQPIVYNVVGKNYQCPVTARGIARKAQVAADAVVLAYTVNEKEICCEKYAKIASEKTGKPIVYAVGEQSCECPVQARVMLDFAKIQAALSVINASEEKVASASSN